MHYPRKHTTFYLHSELKTGFKRYQHKNQFSVVAERVDQLFPSHQFYLNALAWKNHKLGKIRKRFQCSSERRCWCRLKLYIIYWIKHNFAGSYLWSENSMSISIMALRKIDSHRLALKNVSTPRHATAKHFIQNRIE